MFPFLPSCWWLFGYVDPNDTDSLSNFVLYTKLKTRARPVWAQPMLRRRWRNAHVQFHSISSKNVISHLLVALYVAKLWNPKLVYDTMQSRCLSVLDFWNVNLGVYYKLEKKSFSKQTRFFVEFELDFYCLCSLQKSISKSNWFFNFLNLIFRNWK